MGSPVCFPKDKRLITASDYQFVFKKAIRSSDKYFTILARNSKTERGRLGLAISKKAVKLAVQRNRIKRLIREYFRLNNEIIPCCDFVIMAKNGADKMSNQILLGSLSRHFSHITKKV